MIYKININKKKTTAFVFSWASVNYTIKEILHF